MASRLEAIVSRLEAIVSRLDAVECEMVCHLFFEADAPFVLRKQGDGCTPGQSLISLASSEWQLLSKLSGDGLPKYVGPLRSTKFPESEW